MSQHASLTAERWSQFDLDRQVLMIANEMNRTSRFVKRAEAEQVRRGYERVLRLTDLTVACQHKPTLRRELLRWRELAAEIYLSTPPEPGAHAAALKALLQLTPEAAKQIPLLLGA